MSLERHQSIAQLRPLCVSAPALAEKIAFLRRGDSYSPVAEVTIHETHMSLVFLAGDRAYKLKKPVRFPYLDFSTLERRHLACHAELKLNRRLAPDVYRQIAPLVQSEHGLAIGGDGEIVDWLVVMKRLDERQMLDRTILERRLHRWQLDRVVATLVGFYRHAETALISPAAYISEFRRSLSYDRRALLDPRFRLPVSVVRHIEQAQRRFLSERADLLARRVQGRHIVDGHGDLRPEHIFLGDPVRIIDCLEFNTRLRMVDPLDEIAFLCIDEIIDDSAVAPATSPTNRSPDITPPLRRLSAKPFPMGRPSVASSASCSRSARFAPPVSGETMQNFSSGNLLT